MTTEGLFLVISPQKVGSNFERRDRAALGILASLNGARAATRRWAGFNHKQGSCCCQADSGSLIALRELTR
jgi:hypothetical protein